MSFDRLWSLLLVVFLVFLWLAGGTSNPDPRVGLALAVSSLVVLTVGSVILSVKPKPASAVKRGLILMGMMAALILLQLVPLPPGIWVKLPGREAMIQAFTVAGVDLGWQPLSLDPASTRATFLSLLPGFALFMAGSGLGSRQRSLVTGSLLVIAVAASLLGLAQRYQGPDSSLYLYKIGANGTAAGTFTNRNFLAQQVVVALPFLFALVVAEVRRRSVHGLVVALLGLVVMGVMMVGLAVTASRAGIVLAMLVTMLAGLLAIRRKADTQVTPAMKFLAFAGALAMLVIVQFGMIGLLSLAQTDVASDYRATISGVTLAAIKGHLPWGSGFGTFIPVYALYETPVTMLSAYVNQAHNDYLQLVLEGGLPAAILLVIFIVWFLAAAIRVWRHGGDEVQDLILRAASLAVLMFLLHAVVDFGLRMPFLLGQFSLFLGMIAAGPRSHVMHSGRSGSKPPPSVPEPALSKPRQPRHGPYFKPRQDPSAPVPGTFGGGERS